MNPVLNYLIGFALSVALTIASFALAIEVAAGLLPWSHGQAAAGLVALAVLQLLVQAIFFLHLSEEEGPRWRLLSFLFALLVVAIIVGGTLWIMHNLSHGQVQYREIYKEGIVSPQTQND